MRLISLDSVLVQYKAVDKMENEYFLEMSQESELNDALAIFLADSNDQQQEDSKNYLKGRDIDFAVEGSSKPKAGEKRSHAAANNKAIFNSKVHTTPTGDIVVIYPTLREERTYCKYNMELKHIRHF